MILDRDNPRFGPAGAQAGHLTGPLRTPGRRTRPGASSGGAG